MTYGTVPDGQDPLAQRATVIAEQAERARDLVRSTWICSSERTEVPPPPAMILPFARYRTLAEAAEMVASAATSAIADGAGHAPCPRCGAPTTLAYLDLHSYSSLAGADLVVRHTPGASPQLFTWAAGRGAVPYAWSADLDRAIARDATLRGLAILASEGDDAGRLAALEAAAQTIPGDPALLGHLAFANGQRALALSRTIASACVAAHPDDAAGHYWLAQATVEEVASGHLPKAAIDDAVPSLTRAIALRPDYPDAQIALANVARLRGRDDEAERTLRALVAYHPDHPEGNYTLGLVVLAKNPAEALGCFERGERACPNDADYPRSRARALLALGRKADARAAIQRAKALAPNDGRIDQVAAEIARGGGSSAATRVLQVVVGLVLLGTLVAVGYFAVTALTDTPKKPTPPTATTKPVVPPKKK